MVVLHNSASLAYDDGRLFLTILSKHTAKEQNGELCFETGRGGLGREQVFRGTKQQNGDVDLMVEEWKDMLRRY